MKATSATEKHRQCPASLLSQSAASQQPGPPQGSPPGSSRQLTLIPEQKNSQKMRPIQRNSIQKALSQPSGSFLSCKQRLTARVPKTLLFNPACSGPGRRSPTDQVGLTAALLQYIGFTCYRRLPSPQRSNHKHQAESCPSCHSSKAQSPRGCSTHSHSCGGEKPRLTLPQVRHRDALRGSVFLQERLRPAPLPACLPRPSLAVSHLSSSWRKITGPLLETREAPS